MLRKTRPPSFSPSLKPTGYSSERLHRGQGLLRHQEGYSLIKEAARVTCRRNRSDVHNAPPTRENIHIIFRRLFIESSRFKGNTRRDTRMNGSTPDRKRSRSNRPGFAMISRRNETKTSRHVCRGKPCGSRNLSAQPFVVRIIYDMDKRAAGAPRFCFLAAAILFHDVGKARKCTPEILAKYG